MKLRCSARHLFHVGGRGWGGDTAAGAALLLEAFKTVLYWFRGGLGVPSSLLGLCHQPAQCCCVTAAVLQAAACIVCQGHGGGGCCMCQYAAQPAHWNWDV